MAAWHGEGTGADESHRRAELARIDGGAQRPCFTRVRSHGTDPRLGGLPCQQQ